jgi:hypothetical protein
LPGSAVGARTGDGCSTGANGVIACKISTGQSSVQATSYSTGLDEASGMSEVDVINLLRPCSAVQLYYIFGDQGVSGDVTPVTLRIGQAVVYPWHVRTTTAITAEIQAGLKAAYAQDVTAFGAKAAARLLPDPTGYSLPYPTSYWHVYVVHNDTIGLSLAGVQCVRS